MDFANLSQTAGKGQLKSRKREPAGRENFCLSVGSLYTIS